MVEYNFSAGPSVIPPETLKKLAGELMYPSQRQSLIELPNGHERVRSLIEETGELFLEVAKLDPRSWTVLFSHGGGRGQFAAVAMNMMRRDNSFGAYVESDTFAKLAYKEAEKQGRIKVIASSKDSEYSEIPKINVKLAKSARYVHITPNNTTAGTSYQKFPKFDFRDRKAIRERSLLGYVPLVGDFTSELFSRNINYNDFDVIYAGVQKNLGVAGLAVIAIRNDILRQFVRPLPHTPIILNWREAAKNLSRANTPNVFSILSCKYGLEWIKQRGLEKIEEDNRKKAEALYNVIDKSKGYYKGLAKPSDRSIINITFKLRDPKLDALFVEEAEKNGLRNLKGHNSVGGIRASMYNATPYAAAEALAVFMQEFQKRNR